MSTANGESRTWMTVVMVAAPIVSGIVVALISQGTNVRLAELEREAKSSAISVEQSKLRDVQESRRQQFIVDHLPKLLSKDETQQKLGKALLFINYPNEAADILKIAFPATGGGDADKTQALDVQREAEAVRQATGDWSIVISGDQALTAAQTWVKNAISRGYTPASIYRRDGVYRTTVGRYETRQSAEIAAVAIRPQTRPDAYVVALGRWCPNAKSQQEGGTEILVCGARGAQ